MAQLFDVAVIGAGPAGYVAAIRAAQLGLRTVCIDNWKNPAGQPSLGGTCLNVGCIPSKALLESSELYERMQHRFAAHGIVVEKARLDLAAMMARKEKIVHTLTDGIQVLFRKNKVTFLPGRGSLVPGGEHPVSVEVEGKEGVTLIEARHIIVASGSRPTELDMAPFDHERVVDSSGALAFTEVPKRLGIIGAGVIALELGSVWRRLGAEVTLLKSSEGLLPNVDEQVAKEAHRLLAAQGLDFRMGAAIRSIRTARKQVAVEFSDKDGEHKLQFDRLVVAVGRTPNTEGLGAEKVGLKLDGKGRIEVDERCATNLPNIWAVGDVVRGPMLAHKGSEEGVAVAEQIAGQAGHVNYQTIPGVIYTAPEIAWVGQTEQELKAAGAEYVKGVFPFSANGRAHALDGVPGFAKILAHAKTDRVLGVHIIGPYASELIGEAVVAMEFGASAEDLARTVHAHPSLAEALHEAALGVDKRAIHL
ncbi:MAG: dihydrolipoyl dehydrogenase [Pseudomonadota bacterium]